MKGFKKVLKVLGIVVALLLLVAGSIYVVYLRPFMEKMKETAVVQYDKELTIVTGGGGNSGDRKSVV